MTRRHPGKEAGIVVDFVHPATKHDDPVVTLHSLLDRDVYRGGAIVVGPVRRGRGRRLRVERRVLPVTADENRRIEVFERELWRIAVEHLDYGEQVQWAALAGARVAPTGWRRARAMLHFDQGGELKRTFLTTAVERNKNPQLRLKALQEIAAARDAEAFDRALDFVESWPRDDKREGVKVVLQALAEKKIGRRDQANNWIWRCANMTREVHEEYAVQRWPETKRLLGLLVNSSGGAHARNARRLVHAARQQDRRLAAALLAAALPHTAEAGEVINGARTRMSRKPAALARELLRNFPKGKGKSKRRRRKKPAGEGAPAVVAARRRPTVDESTSTSTARRGDVRRDGDAARAAAAPVAARAACRPTRTLREERPDATRAEEAAAEARPAPARDAQRPRLAADDGPAKPAPRTADEGRRRRGDAPAADAAPARARARRPPRPSRRAAGAPRATPSRRAKPDARRAARRRPRRASTTVPRKRQRPRAPVARSPPSREPREAGAPKPRARSAPPTPAGVRRTARRTRSRKPASACGRPSARPPSGPPATKSPSRGPANVNCRIEGGWRGRGG